LITESARAVRKENELQAVFPPDERMGIVVGGVQLHDGAGRPKGCMILRDHLADVDIVPAEPAWTVAGEVEQRFARGVVLEADGADLAGRAIDDASEVFRRL